MITYNAIIKYFEAICDQHSQINSFSYGEISLMDEDKFTEYPAVHLTPTSTSIDDQIVTYGFEVVVFDRYDGENNKMENEAVCLSDSLLLLQDLCKELTKGKYFINEDTLINLQVPISANPFIDTKPDICSGWSTQFSIETPNEVTQCNIPYYLAEQNSGLDIAVPVDSNMSWWSRQRFHSSAIFENDVDIPTKQIVTQWLPIYSKPSFPLYQLNAVPHLTHFHGPTWNPIKNGVYFNFGSAHGGMQFTLSGETHSFVLKIKDIATCGNANSTTINNTICSINTNNSSTQGIRVETYNGTHSSADMTYNSRLKMVNSETPTQTVYSTYKLFPDDVLIKRKEPLTIGLLLNNNLCTLYYGLDTNAITFVSYGINLDGKLFTIGSIAAGFMSDYILEEFVYAPENWGTNIYDIMEWINYR